MKHRSIFIVFVVLCLLLVFTSIPVILFRYTEVTRYDVEFNACAEELGFLVQYLQENHCGYAWLSVDNSRQTLYCPEHGYLNIPTQLQNALSVISIRGFVCKDAQWETIRFQDGRIQLDTVNGQYALVFSPDGKPRYLHEQDEARRILVRHIENDWYHVSNFP